MLFLLLLVTPLAQAATTKTARDPIVKWVWSGGSGESARTLEELIQLLNQRQEAKFQNCLQPAVYYCTKYIIVGTQPNTSGQTDYINGQYWWMFLKQQKITQQRNSYGVVTGPTTTTAGDTGAQMQNSCEPGMSAVSKQVGPDSAEQWCERVEVRTSPSPCAGNPIDAFSGDKMQTETDYAAPDGLLSVTRHYLNQREGWVFESAPRLHDLTGRTPVQSCGTVTASYKHPDPTNPSGTGMVEVREQQCLAYRSTTGLNNEVFVAKASGLKLRSLETSPGVFTGDNMNAARTRLTLLDPATNEGASWALSDTDDTVSQYAADGRLLRVLQSGLHRVEYGYANGLLVSKTDEKGRALGYEYDAQSRISAVVLPDGNRITYGYGTAANDPFLRRVTWPDGSYRQYLYNEPAYIPATPATNLTALTGILDENGVRIGTYSYDSAGRAITTEGAGGVRKFSFNYQSTYTDITDPLGTIRRHVFATQADGSKAPSSENQPAGSGCPAANVVYQRQSNGFLSSKKDFNGNTTGYVHDARGLETSRTEAQGTTLARTITTQWHAVFRKPALITEPGRETSNTYDPATGALLSKSVKDLATGELRTTSYQYEPGTARLTAVDGPRTDVADITSYAYRTQDDSNSPPRYRKGDLWTITNAVGHTTEILEYDAFGNPARVIDPNGTEVSFTYDLRQRLRTATFYDEVTRYDYDLAGLLIKVTQPDGFWLQYGYDAAHRLTDITDLLGNRIHYTLDNAGNRTAEEVYDPTNALRRSQTRVYDALSRLKELRGGNGQVSVYGYDPNGNNTTETVDGSYLTKRDYDALNRLFKVTDAANGITKYEYNALDQLTRVTDPRQRVTNYTVNAFGDVTQLQSPDTGAAVSTYDSAGNLKTRTDAKGQLTSYSYDALNRLEAITYADGRVVTYTHDQGNFGKGYLTTITDASGQTVRGIGPHGRVGTVTSTIAGHTFTTNYSYDMGRLMSVALTSGRYIGFSWNGDQVWRLDIDGQKIALVNSEPFGPFNELGFVDGPQITRSFDLSGRMASHSLGAIDYDTADRITSLTHGGASHLAGSKTYGYDSLHRLTSYSGFGVDIGYGYDANGNRTEQTGTSGTVTSTIDPASNRLMALTSSAGAQNFQYDANGSLTSDGVHTYGYDTAGRLASVDATTSYVYNALGQRAIKTVGGSSTLFVYDEAGHLIGEYDASGTSIQETVWLGDTPVAVVKPSGIYYVHADHLNTPRQIDNQAGEPVWVWDTITFGASGADQDPMATGTSFVYNLRHAGQYYDAETGLFQNWNRDYSPPLGRYAQVDPLGLFGGSLSPYTYANLNPLSFTDPEGLMPPLVNPGNTAIQQNVAIAEGITDPRAFRDFVKNKGPWDYKQRGPQWQNFGNYNYGLTGAATGMFGKETLLREAGAAQCAAGTSNPDWGRPDSSPPYGDDPNDQRWIMEGIKDYYAGMYGPPKRGNPIIRNATSLYSREAGRGMCSGSGACW